MKPDSEELLAQRNWHEERKRLRALILGCGLEERVRWGKLCYAHDDANVVVIYGMKTHCALGFFKGSLLADPDGLLVRPGRNSQAMRQLRFDNLQQIEESEEVITSFIEKAVQAERDGLAVAFDARDSLEYPAELRDALRSDPELAAAFERLTPGRRRAYVLHVASAKQPRTRHRRIARSRPRILSGKGITER